MAGYELKEGKYREERPNEDTLWSAFSYLFSGQSNNTTSYKFAFLKSLLDNLYNVDNDLVLTFDQLYIKFTESYWNLVLQYNIHQQTPTSTGKISKIEKILHEEFDSKVIEGEIPFESQPESVKLDICKKVKKECSKYVVGALYKDLNHYAYSFSLKQQYIQFSPYMYQFLCRHKLAIEKMNYYEWAKFLEKVNDDSTQDHLLTKIDKSTERNNLSVYREILFNEFESKTCFYCGKQLKGEKIHVDHFIPWSFIKDDQLWNFVLSCPRCNERKSNKLPERSYLVELKNRNAIIIKTESIDLSKYMHNYNSNKLENIFSYAEKNGLQQWVGPEV